MKKKINELIIKEYNAIMMKKEGYSDIISTITLKPHEITNNIDLNEKNEQKNEEKKDEEKNEKTNNINKNKNKNTKTKTKRTKKQHNETKEKPIEKIKTFKSPEIKNTNRKLNKLTLHKLKNMTNIKRSFHTTAITLEEYDEKTKGILRDLINMNVKVTDKELKELREMIDKMYGDDDSLFNEATQSYPRPISFTDEEKKEIMDGINKKTYDEYGLKDDLNLKSLDEISEDLKKDIEVLNDDDDKELLNKVRKGESVTENELFEKYRNSKSH